MASGRTGFYLKVLEEGEIGAGDGIERIRGDVGNITVRGLWHLAYYEPQNLKDAKKALRLSSLAPEWRKPMEKRLIQAGVPLE
jgi:MOSC domain-containing protein YiiM